MAPLEYLSFRKVSLLCLVLFLFSSILICALSESVESSSQRTQQFGGRRRLLRLEEEEEEQVVAAVDQQQPKKKTNTNTNILLSTKNNQTKLIKPKTNSTKTTPPPPTTILTKPQFKKLNFTSTSSSNSSQQKPPTTIISTKTIKKLNSTSKSSSNSSTKPTTSSSLLTKKSSDLLKPSTPKNKTTNNKPTTAVTKQSSSETTTPTTVNIRSHELESKNPDKKTKAQQQQQKTPKKLSPPSWFDQEDDQDDLVAEFRDLPSRFQETLLPDLERISTSSKAYITRANKEITRGFKPIVGNKYAATIATVICCAFILLPLLLVSLIFNHFKSYFSLQKILIFIQVYLSIYFSILCLSSLVTGLEPLRFFYATSQSTYVWLQVLQTLAYVLYLLVLLMYFVLVFSTDSGLGSKMLGLGQTFVGYAVGLHYYVSVFHRVVLHQPPKTNWKVHGIYATCFLVICLFARAERRKKAYLEEDGEEGKKN